MTHRYSLEDLLYLMQRLRDPHTGCPWDIQQSYKTIVPSTLEEAYEVADAIEQGDLDHLREELGDLLFQVVFYAQLAKEDAAFDFAAIVHGLTEKLIARHPHVFPDGTLASHRTGSELSEQSIKGQWEAIKATERRKKGKSGVLADVPVGLPAMVRAQKLQKRAGSVGFDFSNVPDAMAKVREELAEVEAEVGSGDDVALAEELGDLLFSVVNVCRLAGQDAETLLRHTNEKFTRRFQRMADHLAQQGVELESADLKQMDAAWNAIK